MAYKKAKGCRGKPCGTCDDQTRTHQISNKAAYAIAFLGIGGGGLAPFLFILLFELTTLEKWSWLTIFSIMWVYGHLAMSRFHKKGNIFEPREKEEGDLNE